MDLRLLSFAWGKLLTALAMAAFMGMGWPDAAARAPLAGGRCWRLLFLLLGILWMQVNLHYRLAWLDQLGKKRATS